MNSETSKRSSFSTARSRGTITKAIITVCIGVGVLLLVLLAGARFAMRGICSHPKDMQVKVDFNWMPNAIEMYRLTGGNYPSNAQGLKALVEKPDRAQVPARWSQTMKTEPLDPWRKPYAYLFPGTKDPTKPELISAGLDGNFGNEDDFSSQDE